MRSRKRIVLIGCGEHALNVHVPALLGLKGQVEILGAFVGERDQVEVSRSLRAVGVSCPVFGLPVEESDAVEVLSRTVGDLETVDGAVISTISAYNFGFAKVCLTAGLDVLLEKPPVCPSNCSWNEDAAAQIVPQMIELIETAEQTHKRLIVATQRRYDPVYQAVLEHAPLKTIHALDTLGWDWTHELPPDYRGWRRSPELTGGKLMHSGYHLVDLVAWWLRRTNPDVAGARVFSTFERFPYPEYRNGKTDRNVEKTVVAQVEFLSQEGVALCLVSFLLSLGGPENYKRENYFILTGNETRLSLARECLKHENARPTLNVQLKGGNNAWRSDLGADTLVSWMPVLDLLDEIQVPTSLAVEDISAGVDHLWSVTLLQALYLSAIRSKVHEITLPRTVVPPEIIAT